MTSALPEFGPLGQRFCRAALLHLGWRYSTAPGKAGSPYPTPGASLQPTGYTNCSVFAWALLTGAYPDVPWSAEDYARMQIMDAAERFSNVDMLIAKGVGVPASETRWTLYQGWRANGSGHTFLTFDDTCRLHAGTRTGPQFGEPPGGMSAYLKTFASIHGVNLRATT